MLVMETHIKTLPILKTQDVILARQAGREIANAMGFSSVDGTRIATAISEITRNVVQHAGASGEIRFYAVDETAGKGLRIVVEDKGRGIAELDKAMQDDYSTTGSLGAGLPGSRRIMDEFEISSRVGAGTVVSMTKRIRPGSQ
jgi:serine/threonine-protein kinase RsbT